MVDVLIKTKRSKFILLYNKNDTQKMKKKTNIYLSKTRALDLMPIEIEIMGLSK